MARLAAPGLTRDRGAISGPLELGACRSIEGCHGFAGAPRACGGRGDRGAPGFIPGAPNVWGLGDRGAPGFIPGAPNVWGVWGAISGPPISLVAEADALQQADVFEQ